MLSLWNTAFGYVPGERIWSFATGDTVFSSPAIDASGDVYFGSEDFNAYALHSDGSLKWTFSGAGDWIDSSPALSPDEATVYFGSWDSHVYAVNAEDGSLRWSYETGALISASPAVAANGTVVVPSNDRIVYALSSGGALEWFVITDGEMDSSPAIDAQGRILVGTRSIDTDTGRLYCISETGEVEWTFPSLTDVFTIGQITSSPALTQEGDIVFGTRNGVLYCLDASGQLRWQFNINEGATTIEPIDSSPAVGADGTTYFAARDGYLYAVDSLGVLEWELLVGDVFYASPALDKEGNIYIGAYSSNGFSQLVCVAPQGAVTWQYLFYGYNDSSPSISPDGSVYFGAHDGNLYKLYGGFPLADSPWPKFRHGLEQRGRADASTASPGVKDAFPEAQSYGGGWYLVDWFGSGWLWGGYFPWIYHLEHGWISATPSGSGQSWFFDPALGWVFASSGTPGFYYQETQQRWLYHQSGTTDAAGGRWFYDALSDTWTLVE